MELDGYCPSLQLAFEYQGEQHYVANNFFNQRGGGFAEQLERDRLKVEQSEACLLDVCHSHEWLYTERLL